MKTSQDLLREGEDRAGALVVRSGARRRRLALGPTALRRGVLLGRYARCDSAGVLRSTDLSRVHLFVLEVAERIWAFDTASTHGVSLDLLGDSPARVVELSVGQVAILANGEAEVSLR